MKSERSALLLSATAAATIGGVGIAVFFFAQSQAILLDGLFNVSYFVAALLTLKVARLVRLPDTEDYPFGYAFFEPLVNGAKGVMILGVSLLALFDAIATLLEGGRVVAVGPAIGYGAFATVACSAAALLLRRAHRHSGSPLVGADAASWSINAIVSGVVLLSFCAIPLVEAAGWPELVPYVDPALVTIIVVLSLGVPVRMAWTALQAFLNRAPSAEVRRPIMEAVGGILADFPAETFHVRMIRPGRSLIVGVHVLVRKNLATAEFAALDRIRERIDAALRELHPETVVDVFFTGDARWAPSTPSPSSTKAS